MEPAIDRDATGAVDRASAVRIMIMRSLFD